jgi:hypothetical protein
MYEYDFKIGDKVASTYFTWDNTGKQDDRVWGTVVEFHHDTSGNLYLGVRTENNQMLEDPVVFWIPYAVHIGQIRKRKILNSLK